MADDLATLQQALDTARTDLKTALNARQAAAAQLSSAQAAVKLAQDRLAKVRVRVAAFLDTGVEPDPVEPPVTP